ncbi:MAG: hypothetical protein ACKVHR_04485 [Pirellulales bacterium]|jgi:hypothetical protein
MIDWQTSIALIIVTGAVVSLLYRGWKTIFATSVSGCGTHCNQCPSSVPDAGKHPQLIQLGGESSRSID